MESTALTEQQLDSLIEKAERLKSILLECEDLIGTAAENPMLGKARFTPSINVGNLFDLMRMPQGILSEELEAQVRELAPIVLKRQDANNPVIKPSKDMANAVAESFFKLPTDV